LNCFAQGGDFDQPAVSLGSNQYQADGDGKYDILFSFSQGGKSRDRFDKDEFLSYSISGPPGLSAADFEYLSAPAGGAGPFFGAAHITRIGSDSRSGWISATAINPIAPVPEPSAAFLFSAGLGFWLLHKCWKRSKLERQQKLRAIPIKPQQMTSRPAHDR
jgi:hypothetical protein